MTAIDTCRECGGSLNGYGADLVAHRCLSCIERAREANAIAAGRVTSTSSEGRRNGTLGSHGTGDAASRLSPEREERNYHQDQDEDQDQDKDQGTPLLTRSPGPGGNPDAELWDLIAAYQRGELKPATVDVPAMPPGAGALMKAISADMQLLMGLRIAAGDDRPLPYAASMAVRRGLTDDKSAAAESLSRLVRRGVWQRGKSLAPRFRTFEGTRTYAPGQVTG